MMASVGRCVLDRVVVEACCRCTSSVVRPQAGYPVPVSNKDNQRNTTMYPDSGECVDDLGVSRNVLRSPVTDWASGQ